MKTCINKSFVIPVLVAAFGSVVGGQVMAQTFTTLHSFTGINSDGAAPHAGLTLSGNTFYGTASWAGSGYGTVFKVNTDGTGFRTLHVFSFSDGAWPWGALVLCSNTLIGTTVSGGTSTNGGTVFRVNTDGTGFTNLYSFPDTAYFGPSGQLVLQGGTIYGTTRATKNGSYDSGTVYAVNLDGMNFTNLHNLTEGGLGPPLGVNLSGNTLYGITVGQYLDGSGGGSVFKLNVDGTGFSTLYHFGDYTLVNGGVILSGDTLYGTTDHTVFKMNTDGTGFATSNLCTQALPKTQSPRHLLDCGHGSELDRLNLSANSGRARGPVRQFWCERDQSRGGQQHRAPQLPMGA